MFGASYSLLLFIDTNKKPFLLRENLILAFFTEASIKKLESNIKRAILCSTKCDVREMLSDVLISIDIIF